MTDNRAPRQLVVINPNTNPKVTDMIREVVAKFALPGLEISVTSPSEGPISIETADDRAVAEPLVEGIVELGRSNGAAGFVLACFDDIGVAAARRATSGPVIDACAAGIFTASKMADRFTIVTTVTPAVARIEQLVERHGATSVCTVRAAGIGVAEAASGAGEARVHQTISEALERDGAQAIVLGSGGLCGQGPALSRHFGLPVIDSVAAAVALSAGILLL